VVPADFVGNPGNDVLDELTLGADTWPERVFVLLLQVLHFPQKT
jgi:hypothetical protein